MKFGQAFPVSLGHRSILVPLIAAFSLACPERSQAAEQLKDRVIREYPQAVARLEKSYERAEGKGVYTRLMRGGTADGRKIRFTFLFEKNGKKKNEHRYWEPDEKQGKIVEQVRCCNPEKYTFTAVKYDTDAALVVRDLNREPGNFDDHYETFVARHSEAMYSVFGIPISRLMEDPSFTIRNATSTSNDGRELIKIEYEYKPTSKQGQNWILRSGWIEVSPADGWAIQRYESQLKPEMKGTVSAFVEYRRDSTTGLNVPVRSQVDSPDGIHTVEFSDYRVGDSLGSGHFTLASFGIPELDMIAQSSNMNQPFYWFLGASILALVVAAVARYASSQLDRQREPGSSWA
jgi:hypothetical protein